MLPDRMSCDSAGGSHPPEFNDFGKYTLNLGPLVKGVSSPGASELPPLYEPPTRMLNLVKGSVVVAEYPLATRLSALRIPSGIA